MEGVITNAHKAALLHGIAGAVGSGHDRGNRHERGVNVLAQQGVLDIGPFVLSEGSRAIDCGGQVLVEERHCDRGGIHAGGGIDLGENLHIFVLVLRLEVKVLGPACTCPLPTRRTDTRRMYFV